MTLYICLILLISMCSYQVRKVLAVKEFLFFQSCTSFVLQEHRIEIEEGRKTNNNNNNSFVWWNEIKERRYLCVSLITFLGFLDVCIHDKNIVIYIIFYSLVRVFMLFCTRIFNFPFTVSFLVFSLMKLLNKSSHFLFIFLLFIFFLS